MKKTTICPQCRGHGFITQWSDYSIWSERCARCNGTGEIEVPIANRDALRSMSDEEISHFFSKLVRHDCALTFHCKECHPDDDICAGEILKWIQDKANY